MENPWIDKIENFLSMCWEDFLESRGQIFRIENLEITLDRYENACKINSVTNFTTSTRKIVLLLNIQIM